MRVRRRWDPRYLAYLRRVSATAQSGDRFVRGCSGKKRYETREDAIEVGYRIYRCRSCRGFHRTTV